MEFIGTPWLMKPRFRLVTIPIYCSQTTKDPLFGTDLAAGMGVPSRGSTTSPRHIESQLERVKHERELWLGVPRMAGSRYQAANVDTWELKL